MILVWKIHGNNPYFQHESDGNFLIKYRSVSVSEYFRYFGVNKSLDFLDKIKDDVGEFYEISPVGKVMYLFDSPRASALDDYQYLTNLHVIENSAFYDYFISEAIAYSRAEVKTEVIFKDVELLTDIILRFDVEDSLKNYHEGQ